jgi:hypothetical protein
MPQVYADKNGSKMGQNPDPNMRIKTEASDGSLVHMQIKKHPTGIEPRPYKSHQYYGRTDNQGSKSHKKMLIFSRFFGRDIKISSESKQSKLSICERNLHKMSQLMRKWMITRKGIDTYYTTVCTRLEPQKGGPLCGKRNINLSRLRFFF